MKIKKHFIEAYFSFISTQNYSTIILIHNEMEKTVLVLFKNRTKALKPRLIIIQARLLFKNNFVL